jgi:hypothetical protein
MRISHATTEEALQGRTMLVGLATLFLVIISLKTWGHGVGPAGEVVLPWHTDQIGHVLTEAGAPPGRDMTIEGKDCLVGSGFHFDVRDEYAFDIDEDVQLTLEFLLKGDGSIVDIAYEKNGSSDVIKHVVLRNSTPGSHWRIETISLERARFAGNGYLGSDFSVSVADQIPGQEMTLCGVSLRRSYQTPIPDSFGNLLLEVTDEHDRATPARVGIYDERGRMPLPSVDAVPVRGLMDVSRVIKLYGNTAIKVYGNAQWRSDHWPSTNQSAFYINGHYGARLPPGRYDIVVGKGLEYRYARRSFAVRADDTTRVKVHLSRWASLRAKGWYSGEDHIHYARESSDDDRNLLLIAQAEDLQVANIVQMGNAANTYFRQYAWKIVSDPRDTTYILVPGQEDPRTQHRGHTLQLNLNEAVREPLHYLLYDEIFERVHAQGGLTGYAHVLRDNAEDAHNVRRGLALDVPLGLVDFVEVLQDATAGTHNWFDYLNLGFKLTPTAGTDYPYHPYQPGAVRSYVNVGSRFTPQAWFEALKQGRTFVTDGPMLDISANGQGPGAELQLRPGEPITIRVKASMSLDVGQLDRLELIEQGETVKTVTAQEASGSLQLDFDALAKHGTWFVVRALGRPSKDYAPAVAVSAPIYVRVNGDSFWKPQIVPEIVSRIESDLDGLLTYEHEPDDEFESDDPGKARKTSAARWSSQRPLLVERVNRAKAAYEKLLALSIGANGRGAAGRPN